MKKLSILNRRRLIRVGVLCIIIPSLAYLGRSQSSPVDDTFIHQPNSSEVLPRISTSNPIAITPYPKNQIENYCEAKYDSDGAGHISVDSACIVLANLNHSLISNPVKR